MIVKKRKTGAFLLALFMAAASVQWCFAEDVEPLCSAPGWVKPDITPTFSEPGRSPMLRSEPLPSAYGFSIDEGLVPSHQTPVKNQGVNGVCWAFATMAAAEANLLLGGGEWENPPDLSETHMIYSCSKYGASANDVSNAEQGYNSRPRDGGNIYYAAAYLMRGTTLGGTLEEASDPYCYADKTLPYRAVETTKALGAERAYIVENIPIIVDDKDERYDTASGGFVSETEEIKRAILSYGAVVTSICWLSSSNYYNSATGAYYVPAMRDADHAISIVGWDDNYSASSFRQTPPGDGAWLIKNSWGTGADAGIDGSGYYWVSYYDGRIGEWTYAIDGVTPFRAETIVHEYDYRVDGTASGAISYIIAFPRETASERLDAVKVLLNSAAELRISVCPDYTPGLADPLTGNHFLTKQTNRIGKPGFYTIPLTEPELITGDCFAVRLELLSGTPELYTYDRASAPRLTAGGTAYDAVLYQRSAGDAWRPLTRSDGNFHTPCIKAVTTDLSNREMLEIEGTAADGGGLQVTVETTMAKTVLLLAAAYRGGRVEACAARQVDLHAAREVFALPPLPAGERYRVFVVDPTTHAPLAAWYEWTHD